MTTILLLLKDVEDLGRSGDVVKVKPGFARNYLLPKQCAVIADANALRMQEKLKEERLKQAAKDKEDAEALAKALENVVLSAVVKVDQEGHMYGSVSALDIEHMLKEQKGIELEKKAVQLKQPIKITGIHTIELKLKEGVMASVTVKVLPEEVNGTEPPSGDTPTEEIAIEEQ